MSAARKRESSAGWAAGAATVERADLLPALRLAAMVAPVRATIPILSHVAIEAGDGRLMIRACDFDTELRVSAPAEVGTPFRTTAPAREFLRYVEACPPGPLALATDRNGVLSVSAEGCVGRFWGMDPDDVLSILTENLRGDLTIGADVLAGMLRRAMHAISTEETRYYRNGIYLHQTESDGAKVLRAVATDGHRMSVLGQPIAPEASWPEGSIVRREALPALLEALDRATEPVRVRSSSVRVVVDSGPVVLVMKAIDGQFPDYARLLSEDGRTWSRMRRADILAALRRVRALGNHKPSVLMSPTPGGMKLSARDLGNSEVESHVPFQGGAPLPGDVGINALYLRDALAQIGGDVTLGVIDGKSPLVFRDDADARARFIVVPLRV